jgi:DNA replication and repair protein RecF
LDDLNAYKKVLSQKQKLLSEGRNTGNLSEDLSSWNEQLIKYGSNIILARKEFVKFLNQHLSEVYSGITGFHRPVDVNYDTLEGETLAEIENAFREKLVKMADREIASGLALVGPHKDDFRLHSDGVYLAPFSSRGELRSQVLALKILELEYLSDGDDKPILLLDDVLSELDESRRTYFLKYLQGRFQTFITTTYPLELAA